MKKQFTVRRSIYILMVIAFMITTMNASVSLARAESAAEISIFPHYQKVEVGQSFNVSIQLDVIEDTMSAQAGLEFAPGVLQCTGVTAGEFFQGGVQIPTTPEINNEEGIVQVSMVGLLGSIRSPGDGVLFTYDFTAISEGVSDIALVDAFISDNEGNMIPKTVTKNGQVLVSNDENPDLMIPINIVEWIDEGSTYGVSYTVRNGGDQDAGEFTVGLYIDESSNAIANERVNGLDVGKTYEGNFSGYQVSISGEGDTVKIKVDTENAISEGVEDNNEYRDALDQIKHLLRVDYEIERGHVKGLQWGENKHFHGSIIDMEAMPEDGYEFAAWNYTDRFGTVLDSSMENPLSITMDQDYRIQATFDEAVVIQGDTDDGDTNPSNEGAEGMGNGSESSGATIIGIVVVAMAVLSLVGYMIIRRNRNQVREK
ncbi:MAG: CARDB domain-containing protein [Chloroflexota bacterium]|nr:CARDB domain-containing protein [Chloroflexota bacterium]